MSYHVLVVDDDAETLAAVSGAIRDLGYHVRACGRAAVARRALQSVDFDVIVSDIRMQGEDGIALCQYLDGNRPDIPVVLMTAYPDVATAAGSMRAGAIDYLRKPFTMDELKRALERALGHRDRLPPLRRLLSERNDDAPVPTLIGSSPAMTQVHRLVRQCARSDLSALITGETGTGKELVARAIHDLGPRASKRFIPLNCAALPAELVESELFGYRAGAFTGATTEREGLFRAASGGTLLLDEVGELPMQQQAKLLRVLESRMVRSVGSSEERRVDTRVLASTNRDLRAAARSGTFRSDLLFRLGVVEIRLPPLRERGDDIVEIARALVARAAEGRPARLTAEAEFALRKHSWPGNIRELENCITSALVAGRGVIDVSSLPAYVRSGRSGTRLRSDALDLAEVERRHIERVLQAVGGNRTEAARRLGIDRVTLYRKLKRTS